MSGFLLDTNVPSELTKPRSDTRVEQWLEEADYDQLFLSVLTMGELLKGITILPESRLKKPSRAFLDII